MSKNQIYDLIKVLCSCAVGVAAILLAQSCSSTWNINKSNHSCVHQGSETSVTSSVDSTHVILPFE